MTPNISALPAPSCGTWSGEAGVPGRYFLGGFAGQRWLCGCVQAARSGCSVTSNLPWADALGNVLLSAKETGLSKDSVANVSLVTAFDRSLLDEHAGRLRNSLVQEVLAGIRLVLEKP